MLRECYETSMVSRIFSESTWVWKKKSTMQHACLFDRVYFLWFVIYFSETINYRYLSTIILSHFSHSTTQFEYYSGSCTHLNIDRVPTYFNIWIYIPKHFKALSNQLSFRIPSIKFQYRLQIQIYSEPHWNLIISDSLAKINSYKIRKLLSDSCRSDVACSLGFCSSKFGLYRCWE